MEISGRPLLPPFLGFFFQGKLQAFFSSNAYKKVEKERERERKKDREKRRNLKGGVCFAPKLKGSNVERCQGNLLKV